MPGPTIDLSATEVATPPETGPARPDEAGPGLSPAEEPAPASPPPADRDLEPPLGAADAVPLTPDSDRAPEEEARFGQGPGDAPADPVPQADFTSQAEVAPETDVAPRSDGSPQEDVVSTRGAHPLGVPSAPRLDVFDEPAPARPSFMPMLAAALLGGVAGAAIVLAFVLSGQLPGFKEADETLAPRLVATEQEVQSGRRILDEAVGRLAVAEAAARAASQAATSAVNLAEEARAAAAAPRPGTGAAPAGPDPSDRIAKLEEAVAAVNAAVSRMDERTNAAASSAGRAETGLADVLARLGAVEKTVGEVDPERAAAYAVALSQLEDAMRRGGPFETELRTASALAEGSVALAPLAQLAPRGVPSIEDLARSFDEAKPRILAAIHPAKGVPTGDAALMDRVLFALGNVVSVSRVGDPEPGDPAAPVNAVSESLARGDLEGAVQAFERLPEPGRAAAADWFTDAKAALDGRAAVRAETAAALQKLSRK
jgi:hypothetical protein